MVFRIEIDLPKIPEILKGRKFEDGLRQAIINGINASSSELRKRMANASPIGGTGELSGSWITNPASKKGKFISGSVSSSAIQALVIEGKKDGIGAKPHFPPPPRLALQRWVRAKLGVDQGAPARRAAFFVAKSISRRGFRARRIFSKVFIKSRNRIKQTIDAFINRFISKT